MLNPVSHAICTLVGAYAISIEFQWKGTNHSLDPINNINGIAIGMLFVLRFRHINSRAFSIVDCSSHSFGATVGIYCTRATWDRFGSIPGDREQQGIQPCRDFQSCRDFLQEPVQIQLSRQSCRDFCRDLGYTWGSNDIYLYRRGVHCTEDMLP